MRQGYVTVGRLRLSLAHLRCLRREELELWVGREEAERLVSLASRHRVLLKPLTVELRHPGGSLVLSPGLTLVAGVEFELSEEPLPLEGRNDDFLWGLLVEVPRALEAERKPVLVEELDARFSRHVEDGVLYALDIMERVCRVYRVPFVVTGPAKLAGAWRWLHTIVGAKGVKGERLVVVDGEVAVVG